ncbi:MAG TPA: hypothetical protein VMN58_05580 [Acidimicrobiales bacterium]|nr:hypothetical protein [Acidimicrobiales bacterium]
MHKTAGRDDFDEGDRMRFVEGAFDRVAAAARVIDSDELIERVMADVGGDPGDALLRHLVERVDDDMRQRQVLPGSRRGRQCGSAGAAQHGDPAAMPSDSSEPVVLPSRRPGASRVVSPQRSPV